MVRHLNIDTVVKKMCRKMEIELRKELKNQGHKLTGRLIESIRSEVVVMKDSMEGLIYFEDYYLVVETGVAVSKIPYGKSSGAKSSKYIDALIKFWKLKGKSEKEARSAAFATANVHKNEGIPTKASYAFSKNNRRTGFLSHTASMNKSVLEQILENSGKEEIERVMMGILKKHIIAA